MLADERTEGERAKDPIVDLFESGKPDGASGPDEHLSDDDGLFTALVEEHRLERLGPKWLAMIEPICRSLAFRYDPRIYARSSRWDEAALEDLLQDAVERLLSKSQLEYMCEVATNVGHVRALLYKQVRFTLADRRQVTVIDNLLLRALTRLTAPPFAEVELGRGNQRTFLLQDSRTARHVDTTVVPEGLHVEAIRQLRILPRLPGHGTERGSAVWTSEVLSRALTVCCQVLGRVTEEDLRKIFAGALTFFATAEVVAEGAGSGERSSALTPEEQALAGEIVDLLTRELSEHEIRVLAGKFAGRSDGDIARDLAMSRPTVDSRKKSAIAKIHAEVADLDENVQNCVLERIQERFIRSLDEAGR